MSTAFEAIVSRQAWYAAEPLEMYDAVMLNTDGKYIKATGTGQFVGIVQYGAETDKDMATVVKGTFPAIAAVAITTGSRVTVDAEKPGCFKPATTSDIVYGVALTPASDVGGLFTISMADVPTPAPAV